MIPGGIKFTNFFRESIDRSVSSVRLNLGALPQFGGLCPRRQCGTDTGKEGKGCRYPPIFQQFGIGKFWGIATIFGAG